MAEEVGSIYYEVDSKTDGLIAAEAQVSKSANNMSKSLVKTDKSIVKVGKSFDATEKKSRKLSNSVRQASLQLSQVAQQGSVTGNYFQALAIQLPDLALGFGTLGVLAGALAGVIAVPLYNAITGVDERTKEYNKTIEETLAGLKSFRLESTIGAIDKLKDSIKSNADELRKLQNVPDKIGGRAVTGLARKKKEIEFAKKSDELQKKQAKNEEALIVLEERKRKIQGEGALNGSETDEEGKRLAALFQAQERAGQKRVEQIRQQSLNEEEASKERLAKDLEFIDAAQLMISEKNKAEAQAKQLHADRLATIDAKRTKSEEAQQKNRIALKQAELAAYSQLGGQLTNLISTAGAEQSAIGKAIFLASQALSVAGIIVNTQLAASQALTIDPTGALAARVTTLGYASAGIAAGVAVAQTFTGRQTGGPVSGGTPYRVNETGPELFTSGGRQYLIPDQNGNVAKSGSGQNGGSPTVVVNVNNLPAGLSAEASTTGDNNYLTVDLLITDYTENGQISKSLQNSFVNMNRRTD